MGRLSLEGGLQTIVLSHISIDMVRYVTEQEKTCLTYVMYSVFDLFGLQNVKVSSI